MIILSTMQLPVPKALVLINHKLSQFNPHIASTTFSLQSQNPKEFEYFFVSSINFANFCIFLFFSLIDFVIFEYFFCFLDSLCEFSFLLKLTKLSEEKCQFRVLGTTKQYSTEQKHLANQNQNVILSLEIDQLIFYSNYTHLLFFCFFTKYTTFLQYFQSSRILSLPISLRNKL